jgi:hypothetical protein
MQLTVRYVVGAAAAAAFTALLLLYTPPATAPPVALLLLYAGTALLLLYAPVLAVGTAAVLPNPKLAKEDLLLPVPVPSSDGCVAVVPFAAYVLLLPLTFVITSACGIAGGSVAFTCSSVTQRDVCRAHVQHMSCSRVSHWSLHCVY